MNSFPFKFYFESNRAMTGRSMLLQYLTGHIGPFGDSTCGDMNQHSDASFAALGFIRHFETTQNTSFLREVSYPFLKDVGEWPI